MRIVLAASLIAILACVSFSSADLVTPKKLGHGERILGMSTRATLEKFKADEWASVVVSGVGEACLGLYVFDARGNCVAHDDFTSPQASDDLTVEWIPADTTMFSVEVRNAGIGMDMYDLALR
jgi:hypothetical protein